MTDKKHQTNEKIYKIRVDGVPVSTINSIDKNALEEFMYLCKKYENCYVDIVSVSIEILFSQYEYNQMERHFKND